MPDLPLMEPIVLVDKPHNQEAHIIVNTHQTFDDMLDTARRINTNLFANLKRRLIALHLRKVVITDPGKVRPATD